MYNELPRPAFGESEINKMSFALVLVFAAATGSGIVGGIFFAFSSFVMAALGRIPPAQGVAAMNSINVAVINPSFMTMFAGTGTLCLGVTVGSLVRWNQPGAKLALAASLVYLVGCVGVTAFCNVPLNDRLASLADAAQAVAFWPRYLAVWDRWNQVRSVSGIMSAGLFTLALSRHWN